MSWRPPSRSDGQARNAGLNPYRERAAILTSSTGEDATLYVRVETLWTRTGGHLWWGRWSESYEVPHGYMMFVEGGFDDWLVGPEELEEELVDWSQNRLRYIGEVLEVEWLDDAASRHVRDEVLELDPP